MSTVDLPEPLNKKCKEAKEQYKILTENMQDVVWQLDLNTLKLVYVSPSIERLRGYTPEEVMSQSFEEIVAPASLAYLRENFNFTDSNISGQNKEIRNYFIIEQPCKNGTTVWTEITINNFLDSEGKPQLIGVSRNYDQQKRQQDELAATYAELAKRKAFLRSMLDVAPCAVCCFDPKGKIIYLNKRFAEAFDLNENIENYPPYEDIIPLKMQKRHLAFIKEASKGLPVPVLEKDPLPHMPQYGYMYGIYTPFLNETGVVEYIVLVIMNITQQKETEKQLLEIQRLAKMGHWEFNLSNEKLICSEGALLLFQINAETFTDNSYLALYRKIHTDDLPGVCRIIKQLLLDHQPVTYEFRVQHEKNVSLILQSTSKIVLDSNGNPIKIVGILADITEQKKLEELEKQSAALLRDFARAMPDLGFIATEEGDIIEIFGNTEHWSRKTSVKNLKKIMQKKDSARLFEQINYAFLYNTVQFGEYTFNIAKENKLFEIRIAPMNYIVNGQRTVACNAIDITEKNRVQRFLHLSYEIRRQRELLNDLVEQKTPPSKLVLDQLWQLKVNLSRPFSCFLITVKSWKGKPPEYWREYPDYYQYLSDSLTDLLSTEIKAVAWESREGIALLCPLHSSVKRGIKEQQIALANHINEVIQNNILELSVIIGIGEFYNNSFQNLALVYSQACEAVDYAHTMNNCQTVIHYLDIGIFQILPLLSDKDKVWAFIERTVGKLFEYDQKKGSNLVLTLEKLLQLDNIKTVADELFVHPKTISFRKKRIESILNLSLDTLDTKTTLNTALKLRQLFDMKKREDQN
jgi:PAS domain S-box-containing protein